MSTDVDEKKKGEKETWCLCVNGVGTRQDLKTEQQAGEDPSWRGSRGRVPGAGLQGFGSHFRETSELHVGGDRVGSRSSDRNGGQQLSLGSSSHC